MLETGNADARSDLGGLLSPGMTLFNKLTKHKESRDQKHLLKLSAADVIEFSGISSSQSAPNISGSVYSPYRSAHLLGASNRRHKLGFPPSIDGAPKAELCVVAHKYRGAIDGKVLAESGSLREPSYRYQVIIPSLI